ncbi:MAG: hypothetical protein KC621_05980 [Myxococcales bacterium]|nr:hypothetical protein [Myxococcales bacterium]
MLALILGTLSAHADAVPPPPEDCPAGAQGQTGHDGPFCTPTTCDGTCEEGHTCRSAGLCVTSEERPCGGMTTPGETCTYERVEAHATCRDSSDCTLGECVIADRCVEDSGCGCATGASPAAVVLLGLLPLAIATRRRFSARA